MFGETLQQVPACSLVAGARCKQRASQRCRTSFRAGKRLQKVRSCGHQGNWVVSDTRTAKLLSSKPAGERNKSEPPSASGVATGAPSPCRGTAAVPGGRGAALLRSAVPRAVPCRALRGRAGPPGRRRQAGTSPPLSPPEASGARHWASCGRCPPQRIPHSPARHGTAPALRPHPRRAPHGESQPWVSGEVLLWGEVSQTREGAFWGGKGPPESSAPHSCPARILHGGASSRAVRGSKGFLLPSPPAFGGPPRVKQCRGFVEGMGEKQRIWARPAALYRATGVCPSVRTGTPVLALLLVLMEKRREKEKISII